MIIDTTTGEILGDRPRQITLDRDNPRKSVEEAAALYFELNDKRKQLTLEIDEAIDQCKQVAEAGLRQLGETKISNDFCSVSLSGGGLSVRYSAKDLDKLCELDAELAKQLGEFRVESRRKEYVRFSLRGKA